MTRILLSVLAVLAIAAPMAASHAHGPAGHKAPAAAAPSGGYAFALAKPGTYALPAVKRAAGGGVIDEHGRRHDLARLMQGRLTLLAFVYTRCGDVCPLATMRMAGLRELATATPGIAAELRFMTMSFDPVHDTPARMAEHAVLWREPAPAAPEWLFLTAPDEAQLQPVLEAYGQAMAPKANPADPGGPIRHILRVFLIDRAGLIRNIYSLDFLDPQLVLNDVTTLLLEETPGRRAGKAAPSH